MAGVNPAVSVDFCEFCVRCADIYKNYYYRLFFFSYIMGKKVKNGKNTNTVYTLTLVVMREGVSRDYIYKLIIQNKYRQTRGD